MTHEWSFQNNHTIYIHGNIIGYIDVDDSIMSRTVDTILVVPLRKKKVHKPHFLNHLER